MHNLFTVLFILMDTARGMPQNSDFLNSVSNGLGSSEESNDGSMKITRLDDPNGCIYKSWRQEKKALDNITRVNADKLAEHMMLIIQNNESLSRLDNSTRDGQLQRETIQNMGPMFDQLCLVSRRSDDQFSLCPASQLRNVTLATNSKTDVFCEARKNWSSFSDCYNAFVCINRTLQQSTCHLQCGPDSNARDYMRFTLHHGPPVFILQLEKDVASKLELICKTNSCHVDCNKKRIVDHCGIREFGLYLRLEKADVTSLLQVAWEMENVNLSGINQCQRFL